MNGDDIAISLSHVSKNFSLPHERVDSVKSLFVNPFRRNKGRKVETQHALDDVSFNITKGEFFGIVGRNGSGKSTLLKIIAGIYRPTKGKIGVNGRLVPFIELGVGFNPELTGRENVYLNGALMGFNDKEVGAKYNAIIEFAELERFMDQKLKNYSSGMQVRLAFSVATILADSEILLIDEVLAVGDADFQRKCFNYFKKLKKEKKTVVFVSHDMSAIREYCERAALIDDSRLIEVGSADHIAGLYDKLFTQSDVIDRANDSLDDRWGTGQVITERIVVETTPSDIRIVQDVIANTGVDGCIIGIRMRDAAGVEILGTNTKIQKFPVSSLRSGEHRRLTWIMPNILSNGTFTIDPAIILDDGITTSDWWNDAVTFTIKKSRKLPYNIDPNFSVEETEE